MIRRTAGLVFALAGLAGTAHAQALQKLSVQASGAVLFATLKDPNFPSKTRLGFEGQLRYTVSRFSIGVGYQRATVFEIPNNGGRLDLSQGFVEPRYVVTAGNSVALYIAGRLGAGKLLSTEVAGVPVYNAGGTKATYGGGAGLLFKLNKRVSADLGGQFFQMSGTLSSGYALARLGLGVGL
jgi:opacity protein-like surface antigen